MSAVTIVKYAGAAYLIYLGVRKLIEREQPEGISPSARSRLFVQESSSSNGAARTSQRRTVVASRPPDMAYWARGCVEDE